MNPDKVRASNRSSYELHGHKHTAKKTAWAAAHPDARRASERKWRQKPESKALMRERSRRWRLSHPENTSESERKWRQKHPEKVRQFAKTRRAVHKGAAIRDFTAAQWEAMQLAFDHRCAYCHRRHKGHLTQDHVLALSKGGDHTASNIVPACQSCNSRKHTGPPLRPVQTPLLTE